MLSCFLLFPLTLLLPFLLPPNPLSYFLLYFLPTPYHTSCPNSSSTCSSISSCTSSPIFSPPSFPTSSPTLSPTVCTVLSHTSLLLHLLLPLLPSVTIRSLGPAPNPDCFQFRLRLEVSPRPLALATDQPALQIDNADKDGQLPVQLVMLPVRLNCPDTQEVGGLEIWATDITDF